MDNWFNLPDLFAARIDATGQILERSQAWQEQLGFAGHVADIVSRPLWQNWPDGETRMTATATDGTSLALVGIREGDWLVAHHDRQESVSAGKMAQLAQELDDLRRRTVTQGEEIRRANDDLKMLAHGLGHDVGATIRRAKASMDPASDAAQHLRQSEDILDQLSRYGRAGSVELHASTFPLQELLEEVQLGLEVTLQSDVGDITGDRDLLTELFRNLIENSSKYAAPATVTIRQQDHVVSIQDNGPGVNEQEAETMFDMFQRHSDEPGTGIGLALCRKIMQKHGGSIHAESGPGCKITLQFD